MESVYPYSSSVLEFLLLAHADKRGIVQWVKILSVPSKMQNNYVNYGAIQFSNIAIAILVYSHIKIQIDGSFRWSINSFIQVS